MPWDTMFSSSRTFLVLIVLLRNCTGWMIWFFRTFLFHVTQRSQTFLKTYTEVSVVGKWSMHFLVGVKLNCVARNLPTIATRAIILNSKKNIQKSKAIIVIFTECATDPPPRSPHHLHGGSSVQEDDVRRGGGYCNNVLCTENTKHTIERHHW